MKEERAGKHKNSWGKLCKEAQKSTEEQPESWKNKQKQMRPQKPREVI